MIKEIKIENFKSIQSLNLELGRLNVFIGANGSGKSNILEAIAFGSAAISSKLDNEFLKNRGIRIVENELFKSLFNKEKSLSPIVIEIQGVNEQSIKLTINLDKSHNWHIDSNSQTDSEEDLFSKEIDALVTKVFKISKEDPSKEEDELNILTQNWEGLLTKVRKKAYELGKQEAKNLLTILGSSHIFQFLIFAPENTSLRKFDEEGAIEPLGMKGEGLFNHLVKIFKESPELFKKINEHLQLLDWFDGFEIPNNLMFTEKRIKIKDRFLEEGLQYFDQRSANEGFLYLLFYLTLFISDETPKFFAIDNIDNAMNPKLGSELIKILAKLAKEHDKQTILTTHNPAILDGINLNDDDQRLFVIYRNGDGHTKARRILRKETPQGQRPVPLSEQFLRGYLGGLPDNF